jgi:cell division protein ZapE
MQIASLLSQNDYRHLQNHSDEQTFCYPLGKSSDAFIDRCIARHCRNPNPKKGVLHVQGRDIHFQLYDESIGRFTFADLCETALGPADYLMIASRLKVLILTGIPALPPERRNEAKRFVTLIDALYEHKVKLLATAETAPEAIYTDGDGAFEFRRTVSRLAEMQSANWMKHG